MKLKLYGNLKYIFIKNKLFILIIRYRSPEVLLGTKKYALGVDAWSVGCIFHEMVEKKVLF